MRMLLYRLQQIATRQGKWMRVPFAARAGICSEWMYSGAEQVKCGNASCQLGHTAAFDQLGLSYNDIGFYRLVKHENATPPIPVSALEMNGPQAAGGVGHSRPLAVPVKGGFVDNSAPKGGKFGGYGAFAGGDPYKGVKGFGKFGWSHGKGGASHSYPPATSHTHGGGGILDLTDAEAPPPYIPGLHDSREPP
eukprot:gene7356-166_t